MKVEDLPISSIIPYGFNNRIHDETQINRIANSIKEFGFNQPIVLDESNVVLVGHGRLLAAQKLGLKEVPVLALRNLNEVQKKAYRILDNKLQNDSTWDLDNIGIDLSFLEESGYALEPWGLESLRDLFTDSSEPEIYEDGPIECENEDVFLQAGDKIVLGPHFVLCGSFEDLTPNLTGTPALWLTDPPYGVSYVGKTKKKLTIENDELDTEDLAALWGNATTKALELLGPAAPCYATVPPGPLHYTFLKTWTDVGILRQQLIWVKDSMVLGHSDYHYKHEPILYGWKPGSAHYFTNDRTKTSVLEVPRPKASEEHPTMKPIELFAELIRNSTRAGAIVLDTFLGSGTTLIAADQLGRVCVGSEIDPKYCHAIIERYQRHCAKVGKPFICKVNGALFSSPIKHDIKEDRPSSTPADPGTA